MSNIELILEHIKNNRKIEESELTILFKKSIDIFYQEGTLLDLSSPISVCGDVHGQFYDVLNLFKIGGKPPQTKYLFLGDYVDRGRNSLETLVLLLVYKNMYPDRIYLLRGNHECRKINALYGFYQELVERYGHVGPWKLCNDVFDYLPLAAIIDDKYYCVHGGLSPYIKLVDEVAMFERIYEIPDDGPVADMCWSDPDEENRVCWCNNQRGAGKIFGKRPVEEFCQNNMLKCVIRAHQLQMNGYRYIFDDKLITVWSAPNYMYRSNNQAAIMSIGEGEPKFTKFKEVSSKISPQNLKPDVLSSYFE